MAGPTKVEAHVTLRAEAAAVGEARALLEQTFARAGVDPDSRFMGLLVVSELVTNAVTHGSGPDDRIDVELVVEGELLRICVRDAARARTIPEALTPDQNRSGGRGLSIVDRLAEWSEQIRDGRREVCAELTL